MKLALARTLAWALLLTGWIGIGALALRFAPTVLAGFALVALWLLALGLVAALPLRPMPRNAAGLALRWAGLLLAGGLTLAALTALMSGGAVPPLAALLALVVGWSALTALASGAVRQARLVHRASPEPPLVPAACGAVLASLVIGDPGDSSGLLPRLLFFVAALVLVLAALPWWPPRGALAAGARACRAGLFDCSLPAWPAGSWRDGRSWPALLAGLAMLPMMAALPLMADWCRAEAVPPQAVVALHLAAMFGPALLARRLAGSVSALARWCAALLVAGVLLAALAPSPWGLLLLAAAHGAAWGLAWSVQLWSPARRAAQGSSPLRAALGYALLTLAFGAVIAQAGAVGVLWVHGLLALAALAGWLFSRRVARGQA